MWRIGKFQKRKQKDLVIKPIQKKKNLLFRVTREVEA